MRRSASCSPKGASNPHISFFQAGPVVLALFGRKALDDDAQAGKIWTGNGGIALAQNLASEHAVDAMMARAEAAWREPPETRGQDLLGRL
jgi:drug/metabolite transporter superfamily protein YnfA